MKTMRKNLTRICTIIAMQIFSVMSFAQAVWTPMGPPESDPASQVQAANGALAIDTGGSPYVIFPDATDGNKATVMKFSDGAWSVIGSRGFSAGQVGGCEITITPSGVPYVLYNDDSNYIVYHTSVMYFDGTSWQATASFPSLYGGRIKADPFGNIYALALDSIGIQIWKYNGSAWSAVGTEQGSGIEAPTMTLDQAGNPYIAYFNDNISAEPIIEEFVGGSWVSVGSIPAAGGIIGIYIAFAISSSGVPYVAYDDPSGSGGIDILSYDGTSWSNVGSPGFTTGSLMSMALDTSGLPYLTVESNSALSASIMKYNGTGWVTVDTFDANYQGMTIFISSSGTQFLGQNVVLQNINGVWTPLGNQGITNGNVQYEALASDSAGVQYMVYESGTVATGSGYASVMKYSAGTWSQVGPLNVSGGNISTPSIAVARDGTPYISYLDASSMMNVRKYSAGVWSQVGSTFLGDGYADYLKISDGGTPYISYRLGPSYLIRWFNGSNWQLTDTVGLTQANGYTFSYDVDKHDTLYAAYTDSAVNVIHVLKNNGSSWVSLNPPTVGAFVSQLSLDSSGRLFLEYIDNAANTGMLLYDGGTWSILGGGTFASNTASNCFALDQAGKLYAAYSDMSNSGKETVKTFNGSAWVTVGQADFTQQSVAYNTSISVAPSGIVYTVFTNAGVWGYEYNSVPDSTVWPGDADANHVVDNNDLLPIGLAYDSTGPARTVQGIVWQGDVATNWADSFSIYAPAVNFKNADCNGDGTVNADDTLAIVTNFGLTHLSDPVHRAWRSGTPALYLSMNPDTAANGDTVITSIILGDTAMPVSNIYGLAFTLHFDPLVIDSGLASFSFISSWLGSGGNSISIHKDLWGQGMIKAAITGINHTARSGSGQIATLIGVITTGNINGKNLSYYLNKNFISDVTAINQHGNPVPLNEGTDSNYIAFLPNGIRETAATPSVNIYPNPASNQVRITSGVGMASIVITDLLGNNVQTVQADNALSETIDLSHVADGVYVIRVNTSNGATTAKLVVTR